MSAIVRLHQGFKPPGTSWKFQPDRLRPIESSQLDSGYCGGNRER